MNDVEAAEKTLASLSDKRDRAAARVREIAEERGAIAFNAHVDGDQKARKRLDQLNLDAATITSELAGIDAAIAEATTRLDRARHAEATKQDRQRAAELRKAYNHFIELSAELDAALALVVENAGAMKATVDEIHRLGGGAPTGQQFLTFGELALQSSLMQTPWARAFRHLSPRERRTFTALARDWSGGATATNIAQRLGEQTTEERVA